MQLHDIAWGSVRRRKGRVAFVLAAVVLGIGTIVGLVSLTRAMQTEVSDELDKFGANIIVTPRSQLLDLAYGGVLLGGVAVDEEHLRLEDAALIRTIPNRRNISAVSPKLVGTTVVGPARVVIVGTRFGQEAGIKTWWQIEGRLPQSADEALAGSDVLAALGVERGGAIGLDGTRVRVVGSIAPTGSIDDRSIFVDLAVAQRVLKRPGAISLIEVSALCRGCPIDDIVAQIGAVLPHAKVAPIRQAVAAREQSVRHLTQFAYAISGLLLAVGMLLVMTTTMASVTERTHEIGILRAVGFRRSHVVRVILLETTLVTAVGGLLGWALGVGAARVLGPLVADLSTPIGADALLATVAILSSALIGVAGGAYPALRAAQLDPAIALRQI
jgi:putative ABC transport system permease protein